MLCNMEFSTTGPAFSPMGPLYILLVSDTIWMNFLIQVV